MPSIVNVMTLLITINEKKTNGGESTHGQSSCTMVVKALMRTLINPILISPNLSLQQFAIHGKLFPDIYYYADDVISCFVLSAGVLLSGPPGVGKSYSIRALQDLCSNRCQVCIKCRAVIIILVIVKSLLQIKVHNLSIPDALASDDPSR